MASPGIGMSYEELMQLEDVKVGLSPAAFSRLPCVDATETNGICHSLPLSLACLRDHSMKHHQQGYTAEMLKRLKNCVICCDEFEMKEKLVTLPCLHVYHHRCIRTWFQASHLCPVCKHDCAAPP